MHRLIEPLSPSHPPVARMSPPRQKMVHRFYPNEMPDVGEHVMVRIQEHQPMGQCCNLIEYGDLTGFMMANATKVPIGQAVLASVIRVDERRGYIDLAPASEAMGSVAGEADHREILRQFTKSRLIHSILCQIVTLYPDCFTLGGLYRDLIWPLYERGNMNGADILEVLVQPPHASGQAPFPHVNRSKIPERLIRLIDAEFKKISTPKHKSVTHFEITCAGVEGVEAVRASLREALRAAVQVKDVETVLRLITPPIYSVTVTGADREETTDILKGFLDDVEDALNRYQGGRFVITSSQSYVGKEECDPHEDEYEISDPDWNYRDY